MIVPSTMSMYHAAGMLTPDGRCKTLDAAADGYVRAEAASALALRAVGSLEAAAGAEPNPSKFTVLVLAAAVNQDGRSSSLTAPNGPAQQALIRSALHAAHLAAPKVGLLQMHGTGTALGDPIEVNAALTALMAKRTRADGPLALSAAKAAMGHAEPAAGAVGLASAILSLESGAAPMMMHLRSVNPYVAQCVEGGGKVAGCNAVSAPRYTAPAPTSNPRGRAVAGVSGFAFQVGGGPCLHARTSQLRPVFTHALPVIVTCRAPTPTPLWRCWAARVRAPPSSRRPPAAGRWHGSGAGSGWRRLRTPTLRCAALPTSRQAPGTLRCFRRASGAPRRRTCCRRATAAARPSAGAWPPR
jgi:hypothetical protein